METSTHECRHASLQQHNQLCHNVHTVLEVLDNYNHITAAIHMIVMFTFKHVMEAKNIPIFYSHFPLIVLLKVHVCHQHQFTNSHAPLRAQSYGCILRSKYTHCVCWDLLLEKMYRIAAYMVFKFFFYIIRPVLFGHQRRPFYRFCHLWRGEEQRQEAGPLY